ADGAARGDARAGGSATPGPAALPGMRCDALPAAPHTHARGGAAGEGAAGTGTLADNAVARAVERWGYVPTLFVVAALGLALNLTPCVYPLISVTVAFFGGRTGALGGAVVGHAPVSGLGICRSLAA